MSDKQKLTPDRIVDAALALIDRDGLEALSTRSLGAALGVKAMALYYHVASKDALLDLVTTRLASLQEFPDPALPWRTKLELSSQSYVAIARKHPRAFVLLAGRRYNTREALVVLDRLLAIFLETGLPPDRAAAAFRSLGYLNNGAGLALAATIEADRRDGFQLNDPAFLQGFPHAAAVLPHLGMAQLDRIHQFGLRILLDGIEREVAALRRP
jgi:AcrR family transcriptional regulator